MTIEGPAMHWDHRVEEDHFEQPGNLFRAMPPEKRQVLFENTARALKDVSAFIQERHIANCSKADPDYGAGVALLLGLSAVSSST